MSEEQKNKSLKILLSQSVNIGNLSISRKAGESIIINDEIEIVFTKYKSMMATLVIRSDRENKLDIVRKNLKLIERINRLRNRGDGDAN